MATQTLIIANTNPTVEVYKIVDGANTYILAQDGYSTNAPNTVSIQIDYSNYLERIATSLETYLQYLPSIELVASQLANMNDNSNTMLSHMQVIADNFEVERAINVLDMKYKEFNDDSFDQFSAVKTEVNNPTQF
jgi:hypothetical protein